MTFKKRQVVMLPTNEKATFNHYQMCIDTEGYYKDKLVSIHQPNLKRVKPQHLYITSDEKIEGGDFYIDDCDEVRQAVTSDEEYWDRRSGYKKIIASTDKSLELPEPSQAFIEKFVKEYNKGNVIKEVLVEYHNNLSDPNRLIDFDAPTSRNNTITIKKVKDSFSWSEAELMLSAFICEHCPEYSSKGNAGMFINKWTEENL